MALSETWALTGDTWALYTEEVSVVEAAKEAGLKLMAEYYRNGQVIAWQFTGPKAVVVRVYPAKCHSKKP